VYHRGHDTNFSWPASRHARPRPRAGARRADLDPAPKEKRERPTREAIVAAATGLAGTRGLDAVSVRRVAAALQTRPMDLYRYFAMDERAMAAACRQVIKGLSEVVALLDGNVPGDDRTARRIALMQRF
jgi:AcrR family transcriptional regulator